MCPTYLNMEFLKEDIEEINATPGNDLQAQAQQAMFNDLQLQAQIVQLQAMAARSSPAAGSAPIELLAPSSASIELLAPSSAPPPDPGSAPIELLAPSSARGTPPKGMNAEVPAEPDLALILSEIKLMDADELGQMLRWVFQDDLGREDDMARGTPPKGLNAEVPAEPDLALILSEIKRMDSDEVSQMSRSVFQNDLGREDMEAVCRLVCAGSKLRSKTPPKEAEGGSGAGSSRGESAECRDPKCTACGADYKDSKAYRTKKAAASRAASMNTRQG